MTSKHHAPQPDNRRSCGSNLRPRDHVPKTQEALMRLSLSAASILLISAARSATGEPLTGTPVSLSAADGTKLVATYYAGDKPGPGILLLHQCNRDRSTWS